jgi:hypothetical protein
MRHSFGRRILSPVVPQAGSDAPPVMAKFARPAKEVPQATPAEQMLDSVGEEIREWKKTRRSRFPFQLLLLVASLSFGAAALVLPAGVSDWMQYLLYVFSAASLYVAFFRKKNIPTN